MDNLHNTHISDTPVIKAICTTLEKLDVEIKQLKKQLREHTATEQKITVGSVVNYCILHGKLPRLIIKTWDGFYVALDIKTGRVVTPRRDSVEELVSRYDYKFIAVSLKEYYDSKVT